MVLSIDNDGKESVFHNTPWLPKAYRLNTLR